MTGRYDVAVVGGGSAGVAAALAAAGHGARTLLLEASDRFGGNASLALVHTICGLYLPADGPVAKPAHPGLPTRLARRLQRAGAAGEPERAGRVFFLPIDPRAYGAALAEAVAEAKGLVAATDTKALAIAEDGGGFVLRHARGEVQASLLVDATGDAAVAAQLGAERTAEPPERLQLPSYIVALRGVGAAGLEGYARLQLTAAVAGAARHGELPAGCESVVVRSGPAPGTAYLTLGVARPEGRPYAPLDVACREELEAGARRAAERVVEHLRKTRAAFAWAEVDAWPARLGLRETARLRSEIELDREDVVRGRRRDDEVALSTWPVELWRDHRRARFEHPDGPCGVPLGALRSRSHLRLGCAGRCMGGSQEALGALRVIGTALATGEAIGIAAALAADAGGTLADVEPARVRAATGGGSHAP